MWKSHRWVPWCCTPRKTLLRGFLFQWWLKNRCIVVHRRKVTHVNYILPSSSSLSYLLCKELVTSRLWTSALSCSFESSKKDSCHGDALGCPLTHGLPSTANDDEQPTLPERQWKAGAERWPSFFHLWHEQQLRLQWEVLANHWMSCYRMTWWRKQNGSELKWYFTFFHPACLLGLNRHAIINTRGNSIKCVCRNIYEIYRVFLAHRF
jgi:hypothetical protein